MFSANYLTNDSQNKIRPNYKNFERSPHKAIRIWSASSNRKANLSKGRIKSSSYNPTPKSFAYGLSNEDTERLLRLFIDNPNTKKSIEPSKPLRIICK